MNLTTACKDIEIIVTLLYLVLCIFSFMAGNFPKSLYYFGVVILMIGLVMMK